MNRHAILSADGMYRYLLLRQWNAAPYLGWIMLNPSTADAHIDDATIRLCCGWAMRHDFGGIRVVNLFAYRSTNPKALYVATDPIGPENMQHIADTLENCKMIVCAWGRHGNAIPTDPLLPALLRAYKSKTYALRINKDGSPAHPLRIPYSTWWVPYGR
jgi:hypothetical protein